MFIFTVIINYVYEYLYIFNNLNKCFILDNAERKIPIDEIVAVKPGNCARSAQNSSSTLQQPSTSRSEVSLESEQSVEASDYADVQEDQRNFSQYYVVPGGSPTGNVSLIAGPDLAPPPLLIQPRSNSASPGFQLASDCIFYMYVVHRIRPQVSSSTNASPTQPRSSSRSSNERPGTSSTSQRQFDVEEQNFVWRLRRLAVRCESPQMATKWLAQLRAVLFAGSHRPRRLLAIVNPVSGRGKSLELLAQVQPYYQLAGVRLDICGIVL